MTKLQWQEAYKKKVVHPEQLEIWAKGIRDKKQTIATLNGSFDLLHAGHLEIIFAASQFADKLIVLLNTDASIQKYKSKDRPLIPLKYRLEMMAALEFVSYVSWFEETDPIAILSRIKPDVHVNGSEYGKDCIEAPTVLKYGGRIEIVEKIPGLSTSEIITKIESNAPIRRNEKP